MEGLKVSVSGNPSYEKSSMQAPSLYKHTQDKRKRAHLVVKHVKSLWPAGTRHWSWHAADWMATKGSLKISEKQTELSSNCKAVELQSLDTYVELTR